MKKNWLIGIYIFVITFLVYLFFCKKGVEELHYFLPLANSILRGHIDVNCTPYLNELVSASGKCFVVYPPAPALALLPFALLFGMKLSQVYPQILLSAFAGAIFYLFLAKLTKPKNALILSLLLVFGTNFFMTSMIGRSWYFAHICAVFFLALALYFARDKKAFLAGLFLAFAGLSRLPVFLAFPALLYLILKPFNSKRSLGEGPPSSKVVIARPKAAAIHELKDCFAIARNDIKRRFATALGDHALSLYFWFFLPILFGAVGFALYNFLRFGNVFQTGYSLIPGVLDEPFFRGGIFSLSYIPRNLEAIFISLPDFGRKFPFVMPNYASMSLFLATPALILIFASLKNKLSRVMILTSLLVLIPSFLHGTIGFSQFGYRFSLDVILLLIVALIPVYEKLPRLFYLLFVLSILINFYVVVLFNLGVFSP
ncbi:MAG: hypothetical protein ABIJ72_04280 [bacterium]